MDAVQNLSSTAPEKEMANEKAEEIMGTEYYIQVDENDENPRRVHYLQYHKRENRKNAKSKDNVRPRRPNVHTQDSLAPAMLFLNTQPVDRNCGAKYDASADSDAEEPSASAGYGYSDGYGDGACRHLSKATIILTLIYLITSVVLCVLHIPVSLCAVLIPLAVLICAAVAAHHRAVGRLWLCCIAATLGTFGKMLAIITYTMVFGFSGIDDEYSLSPGTSKNRRGGTNARHSDADYSRFFAALLFAELILLVVCVCAVKFCRKCLR